MQVVGRFREAGSWLLVTSFVKEEDLNVPVFHRKTLDLGGFVDISLLSNQLHGSSNLRAS